MQSKRAVDVNYRGRIVPKVPVVCIAAEVMLRLRTLLLQKAVATKQVPELSAEKIMGCYSAKEDEAALIDPDVVAQAILLLLFPL